MFSLGIILIAFLVRFNVYFKKEIRVHGALLPILDQIEMFEI